MPKEFMMVDLTYSKTTDKFSQDEVDKLSTFADILQYGIQTLKLKDSYFGKRIRELRELCAEEDYAISLNSLKTMLLFIANTGNK